MRLLRPTTAPFSHLPQDPVNGAQQAGSWAVRETFVAIVTTNVPMIFPLVRRWFSPIFGSISSTFTRSRTGTRNRYGNPKRSDLPAPGSIKLDDVVESNSRKKGRPPYSQYPITEITRGDSEEYLNKPQPPLPASMPQSSGISKNVEIRIEETPREECKRANSSESSLERGEAYFTVEAGERSKPTSRSKSFRGSMRGAFQTGGDKKDGSFF